MLLRTLFWLAPPAVGALIFSGAVPLSGSGVSLTVPEPVDTVALAVSDLEFGEVGLGTSGSTRLAGRHTADAYTWTLYVKDKPVANLIAKLEPRDGGTATRVTSEVMPLPAAQDPDMPHSVKDLAALSAIFGAALEEELNGLLPESERMAAEEAKKAREGKIVQAATLHTLNNRKEIMADMDAMANEWNQRDAEAEQSRQAAAASASMRESGISFEAGQPMMNAKPMVDVRR